MCVLTDDVPPPTFAALWDRSVASEFDRPFLIFEGPEGHTTRWTYGEFDAVVDRAAGWLSAQGVRRGDAVHLALTNSPTFVAVWLAATVLGAWIVPSDPMAATPELHGHLTRTEPVVGFCAAARSQAYRAAAPATMLVIEIDEADTNLAIFDARAIDRTTAQIDPTDRAAVMFTSGTTGPPKGVELTQANYSFAGMTMAAAAGLQPEHRQIVVLPLFHANAQYYSIASAIAVGASVALMHTFSASSFLAQCARHRATHASLFAAPIRMILARTDGPVDGVVLQHCWYAMNISASQFETLTGLLGCVPRQLYGMTETIPAVLTDRPGNVVASSIGLPTVGCRVDVQRPDGSSTEVGEVGEIVVGGHRGSTLFAGYLDDPTTTDESFRDGWFLTGDRAWRDESGRYFFDGRRHDVLKVSGENVSTVEVEHVVSAHPNVLEAAVVGMADEIRDEVPVAYVVPRHPHQPPTIEELHQWCAQRLSKAKRPQQFILIEQLPRTSVGKIRKFLLRDPSAETG